MKVLILGVAGGLAQKLALVLAQSGHSVVGVDARPWKSAPREIEVHRVDLRKRAAEDVFRRHRPDAVIHMATVTHLVVQSEDRYRINLGGTRAVFEHSHRCLHGIDGGSSRGQHLGTGVERIAQALAGALFVILIAMVGAHRTGAAMNYQLPLRHRRCA